MKEINVLLVVMLVVLLGLASSCSENNPSDANGGDSDTDSDGDTDSDTDTDSDADLGDPCPLDNKVGDFKIFHQELYSAITGTVKNGVVPITVEFEHEQEGDCFLLQKINPICDPPCESDEACDHGEECVPEDCPGVCVPYPLNQNAGTVEVSGLTTEVSIEPNAVNDYQDTSVDHPPFKPGSAITLAAAGGDVEGFTLEGMGVTPLVTENPDWTIERDKETLEVTADLTITWTPASEGAQIYARLNVDQHGNSPATMHCYFEDDGEATISMGLLDTFTAYGVTGYASAFLARRTLDSTNIAEGCIELETASIITTNLVVTNHDPDEWPTDF